MRSVLRELASKGFVYGLGTSFSGLVSLLLIPFLTHELTAAEYGRYAIAEMMLSLLLVVSGLGMNVVILARYPSVPVAERDRFFGSILSFMVPSAIALAALFLGIAGFGGGKVAPVLDTRLLYLIAGISALESTWLLFATLYRAQGRAWLYIGASALQGTVALVSTVYLILRKGYRDEGILVGRLLADAVLIGLVLLPQMSRYRPNWDPRVARALLRIGLPLIPATFSSMWVLTSPRYFIEWYGSVTDVGVFAMSSKIAGILQLLFVQPFAMAWMVSIFTIFKRPDAERIYARVLTYYVLVGTTAALTIGLLGEVLVPVLARQRFPLSPAIICIIALAQVASGLMYPLNVGPYVLEQTSKVTPVFVASSLLITVLGIAIVPRWGAIGAALALLLVYLVQALLLAGVSQKLYPISHEARRLPKVLGSLGGAFVIATVFREQASSRLATWLSVPLFLALAILLLIATRFPNQGEVAGLRAAFQQVRRWQLGSDLP